MLRRPLPLLLLAAGCASSGGADARYERGWALLDKGEPAAALPELDEAIRLRPDFARAYRARGGAHLLLNDLPRARADFDRALELDPSDALAYYNRGLVRHQAGDIPGAFADYGRSIEIDPAAVQAWTNRGALRVQTGDLEGAVDDLTRASRFPDAPAQVFHNLGRAYQLLSRHAEALEAYGRAIEKGAGARTRSYRALSKARLGDGPGAAADMAGALEADPREPEILVNDASLKEGAGDVAGALAALDRAVEADPRSAVVWGARGMARLRAGRHDEAIADLGRALEILPWQDSVRGRLALALSVRAQARIQGGASEAGLKDAEEALRRAPAGWRERPQVLVLRGQARLAFGDFEGAAEDCRAALQEAPADWPLREEVEALRKTATEPRPFTVALDGEGSFVVCEAREGAVKAVVIGLVPARLELGDQALRIRIGGLTMNIAGHTGLILIGSGGRQLMGELPPAWARDLARLFREERKAEPGLTLRRWLADEVRVYPAPALERLLEGK